MGIDFFLGLDLGQAADHTALVIVQRLPPTDVASSRHRYELRHLERFRLDTPYPQLVQTVAALVDSASLRQRVQIAADQTGVGRAVVDLLRQATTAPIMPITITGGHNAHVTAGGLRTVPKKDLVTNLQLLLQERRLRIASTLAHAELLVRELENFHFKVTASANETFGAGRHGQHDDLVLATALACWCAERSATAVGLPYVIGDTSHLWR